LGLRHFLVCLCLTPWIFESKSLAQNPTEITPKSSYTTIDESIAEDKDLALLISLYSAKVRELETLIGTISSDLRKGGIGGGEIGSLVADSLKAIAEDRIGRPVHVAVTNSGGLRRALLAVRLRDIYELLPFENSLYSVEVSGAQLIEILKLVLEKRDAQSGAVISYRTNGSSLEFAGAKLKRGRKISEDGVYTLITTDYMLERGGDYSLLKTTTEKRPLGLNMRDALIKYIKNMTSNGLQVRPVNDNRFRPLS
jgi:2',3'-cyclic-nucleotide 2'-phosphodiesterase (5'-nucleotidase family)